MRSRVSAKSPKKQDPRVGEKVSERALTLANKSSLSLGYGWGGGHEGSWRREWCRLAERPPLLLHVASSNAVLEVVVDPPSSPTLALLVARSQRTCYREKKWVKREELGAVRRFKPGHVTNKWHDYCILVRKWWPSRACGWPSCSAL